VLSGLAVGGAALALTGRAAAASWQDTAVTDPKSRRRIGLRIRLPDTPEAAPLLLYSPGLGSGVSNGAAWCEAWRQAGFVVVTMSHPVTNDEIWNTGRRSFADNLAAALSGGQYPARVVDTRFVIAQCLSALGIEQRIDGTRIGVAGHSYGAITVQALAVESRAAPADARGVIRAAIALSPGVLSVDQAGRMAAVRMPFFCVTGDHDNFVTFSKEGHARRLGVPLANRLAVYGGLPRGAKQLLVQAGADHMTFAGEPIDGRRFSRDVPGGRAESEAAWARVSATTTAFWQRVLAPNGAALPSREAYLATVKAQLGPRDRFEIG
jgi:predicted esterase